MNNIKERRIETLDGQTIFTIFCNDYSPDITFFVNGRFVPLPLNAAVQLRNLLTDHIEQRQAGITTDPRFTGPPPEPM
jgi:hypothetical protein